MPNLVWQVIVGIVGKLASEWPASCDWNQWQVTIGIRIPNVVNSFLSVLMKLLVVVCSEEFITRLIYLRENILGTCWPKNG